METLVDGNTVQFEAHAECREPPQQTSLGGLIEIHGQGGKSDWTLGCIAIDNTAIDSFGERLTLATQWSFFLEESLSRKNTMPLLQITTNAASQTLDTTTFQRDLASRAAELVVKS